MKFQGFARLDGFVVVFWAGIVLTMTACRDNRQPAPKPVPPQETIAETDSPAQHGPSPSGDAQEAGQPESLATNTPTDESSSCFEVQVREVIPGNGKVRIAIFNSEQGFHDRNAPIRVNSLFPSSGVLSWAVEELPVGKYAVAVFQDENGNEKVDKDIFGRPTEAYGFSNQSADKQATPTWAEAEVDFEGESLVVKVTLR